MHGACANACATAAWLLMVDEVQTGNGRTGALYSYMNYGITPDVVTTAKGLGGGLPLGAALLGERVANVLAYGDHGSTFGGNPVCCAGALSVLNRIDDALLAEVREKGAFLTETFRGAPGVRTRERDGADDRRSRPVSEAADVVSLLHGTRRPGASPQKTKCGCSRR